MKPKMMRKGVPVPNRPPSVSSSFLQPSFELIPKCSAELRSASRHPPTNWDERVEHPAFLATLLSFLLSFFALSFLPFSFSPFLPRPPRGAVHLFPYHPPGHQPERVFESWTSSQPTFSVPVSTSTFDDIWLTL